MDLFSKDPKDFAYSSNPLDREIAQSYAQRFWDAGNQTVLLIYAAAFGVYVALGQYPELRNRTLDHEGALVVLALLGNAALIFLLWRMACHEYRLTRTYSEHPLLIDAIWSALHMRITLVCINAAINLFVLTSILKRALAA
ncbi:hypothetical protein GFM44_33250 [Rhizobium leguminosarum bv. viciae]|nr:hypothetical protein [Rhizobium leguminosarum bv. viciae]